MSQGSPARGKAAPPLHASLHFFNKHHLLLLITEKKKKPIAGSVSALVIVHLSNSVNLLFEFDFLRFSRRSALASEATSHSASL